MNASGNRSINLGLCAGEEHTNVTSLSYFQEQRLAAIIEPGPVPLEPKAKTYLPVPNRNGDRVRCPPHELERIVQKLPLQRLPSPRN